MTAPADPPRFWSPLSYWTENLWQRSSEKLEITFRLLVLAGLVGVLAGAAAILFQLVAQFVWQCAMAGVAGYHPVAVRGEGGWFESVVPHFTGPFRPWTLLVLPAVGGLLSGLLVHRFAPEASGSGAESVIDAYHRHQGHIAPRVPLVKLLSSAVTIGFGGSAGKEGPIGQVAAGVGATVAQWLGLGPKQRRVLMIAGMGAGVGAIFKAPIAGAIFAAEVLYRDPEFESEVLVPAGLASAVAYAIYTIPFYPEGFTPLFGALPPWSLTSPLALGPYLVLALVMAAAATLYSHLFAYTQKTFEEARRLHPVAKPVIGGLLTGVVGTGVYLCFRGTPEATDSLSVFSYGYGILQDFLAPGGAENAAGLRAGFSVALLLAVASGKMLTSCATVGSGGSGGVFGPSIVIGGCIGAAVGIVFHRWLPGLVADPGPFMLIGAAGFFSAAARTPFSTLLMVTEMTGSYNLLSPTLFVCLVAYRLSPDVGLYRAQVAGHLGSPAHRGEYVRTVLSGATVDRFLDPAKPPLTITVGAPLSSVVHDLDGSHSLVLPVTDDQGDYRGMVCLQEVHVALHSPETAPLLVAEDLMRDTIIPLYRGDTLIRAMELFARNELAALPIVEKDGPVERVIGVVRRSDVQTEYLKHVHAADPAG